MKKQPMLATLMSATREQNTHMRETSMPTTSLITSTLITSLIMTTPPASRIMKRTCTTTTHTQKRSTMTTPPERSTMKGTAGMEGTAAMEDTEEQDMTTIIQYHHEGESGDSFPQGFHLDSLKSMSMEDLFSSDLQFLSRDCPNFELTPLRTTLEDFDTDEITSDLDAENKLVTYARNQQLRLDNDIELLQEQQDNWSDTKCTKCKKSTAIYFSKDKEDASSRLTEYETWMNKQQIALKQKLKVLLTMISEAPIKNKASITDQVARLLSLQEAEVTARTWVRAVFFEQEDRTWLRHVWSNTKVADTNTTAAIWVTRSPTREGRKKAKSSGDSATERSRSSSRSRSPKRESVGSTTDRSRSSSRSRSPKKKAVTGSRSPNKEVVTDLETTV
ncbi:unnamed protein product [Vitrella brassicaformis CCMP3155]|uniref:Uncharacterized protein n=1 Tax=Vitrella brassicaformis (strain CCMP3155) TaxID=1169540 RepID=A0A0G4GJD0_VITBC|nr:unnamed protein product [Vitrella brassicaformis CCMP3155]|eukprot:CEM29873.1 unnamed protein product [Vitrella brassicaformis CCMP3155]